MNRIALAALLALSAAPLVARAEVKSSAADGFFLAFSAPVAASTTKTYKDITQIQRWWDSEHTYSGKAANLYLKAEAGGCLCERWKDGSVEHGRVIMALPGKLLRLETALGPLQERALNGVLNFWIKTADSATTLTVEYRVNGSSTSGLDQLAPSVDEVLGVQVDRLRRYIATGNPDAPPVEDAAQKSDADGKPDASVSEKPKGKPKPKPKTSPEGGQP